MREENDVAVKNRGVEVKEEEKENSSPLSCWFTLALGFLASPH